MVSAHFYPPRPSPRRELSAGAGERGEAGPERALQVELLVPAELTSYERTLWRAAVEDDPDRASPFFRPEFALAAGLAAPHARVAVFHSGGEIRGFYPFQLRGGVAQPLAAPLNDYQGVITVGLGPRPDLGDLPGLLGTARVCAGGWVGPADRARRTRPRATMAADLAAGWEAYAAEREREQHKFFKDKRRARRALEREFGPTRLLMDRGGRDQLDRIVELKRDQYRRTGRHDIFACGWTRDLLEILLEEDGDFGGRISVLEAGGVLVALEYSLVAGTRRHFWFPTFEPCAARHSPGVLLTLDSIEAGARAGVTWFDFGLSGEPYKKYFANRSAEATEGEAVAPGWRVAASGAVDAVERIGDRFTGGGVSSVRRRARRHLEVITACESSAWRRLAGVVGVARAILTRPRRSRAGVS